MKKENWHKFRRLFAEIMWRVTSFHHALPDPPFSFLPLPPLFTFGNEKQDKDST